MSICYYSCIKEDVNQSYVDALPRFILGHFRYRKADSCALLEERFQDRNVSRYEKISTN